MLLRILMIALAVYGGLLVILFVFQERLVFLPNVAGRDLMTTPESHGLEYEDLEIATDDGETLHAWWLPAPEGRGTVLFSHGNAGNISHRMDSIRIFHSLGMNVLIYDYRGYGQSSGRASEQGTYRDIEAVWNYLTDDRGLAPESVVLFGRSLGGAVSAWLAARTEPGGLILESSFTSVPDLGQEIYWWLPVRWLARMDYDTRSRLGEVSAPVLVVHGPDDEIIPFSHGQALYEAAGEPRELLEIRGDHNSGFMIDRERYMEGLDAFFDQHLRNP